MTARKLGRRGGGDTKVLEEIDRELLQDLDRHLRGPQGAPPMTPEAHQPPAPRADITGVLEAIQFAASSMNSMAGRVEELESHSQAFERANHELDAQNRQLSLQLQEAIEQRDATAASLEAGRERAQRLEGFAAQNISRANALEHDLASACADLAKVVELVRKSFGA